MTASMRLLDRVASAVESRTDRRSFIGRSALVGSAVAVTNGSFLVRPGTAYATVCSCPNRSSATRRTCGCGDLCCDGYTEFCCQIYGDNSCPPDTVLAGWWKVDNSSFCDGAARYYMDCNESEPQCVCGSRGVCRSDGSICQCRSCSNRADGCTTFRYGNCNNDISCIGPIMCRVVTCTEPWLIDPSCTTIPRTDENTRNHHRPCLEDPVVPTAESIAWARALFADYLEREPDDAELLQYSVAMTRGENRSVISQELSRSVTYIGFYLDDLYDSVFGRGADETGRAFWTEQIIDGLPPTEVGAGFYASEEFFAEAGSIPGFVIRLYQEILEREPDFEGLGFWVEQIEDADDRLTVSRDFYRSLESRRQRVTTLYLRFLGREPDEEGRDFWAERLLDEDDLVLATHLSGSTEYLDLAVRRFS